MEWMPWQSVHTGACQLPFAIACPWMLWLNSFAIASWHCPHVVGHIKFEDGRLRILGVKNFVRAVAVGAHRGFFRAPRSGVSMNAQFIRGDHLFALSAVVHHKFLAVTCAASGRNVGVMYARFRVAGRQQFMRAAVAVNASGRLAVSSRHCLSVEAAIVGSLLIGMAGRTADF